MTTSPLRRTLIASALLHTALAATLWLNAADYTVDAIKPPEVIDTTILPPPEPVVETPAPSLAPTAKKNQAHAGKAAAKGKNSQAKDTVGDNANADGNTASAGNADAADKTGDAQGQGLTGADKGATETPSVAELPSGVPVDVKPSGGFTVKYNVTSTGKLDLGGSGSFTYKRDEANYSADLSITASPFKVGAHSKGEIRPNTLATTEFHDGYSIFGIGKNGSRYKIKYNEELVDFNGKGGAKPLPAKAMFDYVSAIVYIQSLLQQGKHPQTLSLYVGKKSDSTKATVTFGTMENISVYNDPTSYPAIPASFAIESGSIKSLTIWFVPSKQSLPYKMSIVLKEGTTVILNKTE